MTITFILITAFVIVAILAMLCWIFGDMKRGRFLTSQLISIIKAIKGKA